jgi:transposase, IS5 family
MTIRERDRQPGAAMPAVPRHHRYALTSQRMPRIGDFYFCWKPAGMVLQCVTDFKHRYGWDRTRLDGRTGAAIWCGHGVFAHNLVKIGSLAS